MITKLLIRCYGEPTYVTELDVLLTDNQKEHLVFDRVTQTRENGLATLTFTANQPIPIKPWRISDFVTKIPGLEEFVDVYFTTDRFMVAFDKEMINRFNNNL